MISLTSSVLIPSFGRPASLQRCVAALARQRVLPDEVVVVWQGDDTPTRDAVEALRGESPFSFVVVHCPVVGIVPAENRALDVAKGDVVLMVDDDVVVPPDWIERHLAHYQDPEVGAVGGPYRNIGPDGTSLAERTAEPVGRVTWYGRVHGNTYDHPREWCHRPSLEVDHLAGGNMSLRRSAFDRFEVGLRPYWRLFELDACLQVKDNGYRVMFDFANLVEHYFEETPANTPGRGGDLQTQVYNDAYNQAFTLAKHTPWFLRTWRWLFLLAFGTVNTPGPLSFPLALWRFGNAQREGVILWNVWCLRRAGWRAGARGRSPP